MTDLILKLHKEYNRLCPDCDVEFNMARESQWYQWLKWKNHEPFTIEDLRAVIRYRRMLVNEGRQFHPCLRFGNVVGQPDRFEEDLALARTHFKIQKTDRDRVIEMSGREPRIEKREKLAGPIAASIFEQMRKAIE
jgi:hypothetical protein